MRAYSRSSPVNAQIREISESVPVAELSPS